MDLGKLDWVLQSGTRYGGSVLEPARCPVFSDGGEAAWSVGLVCGQRTLWRRTLEGSSVVGVAACVAVLEGQEIFPKNLGGVREKQEVYLGASL